LCYGFFASMISPLAGEKLVPGLGER
jgi:hypothetical protein